MYRFLTPHACARDKFVNVYIFYWLTGAHTRTACRRYIQIYTTNEAYFGEEDADKEEEILLYGDAGGGDDGGGDVKQE